MAARTITIIGGGLAGLTLGIGLRQRGVPVTLWEAGHYPRHRVCGEFISGRGMDVLTRYGLHEIFKRAGAVSANTTAFFSATTGSHPRKLPAPALCLSRYVMDELLAKEFRQLGGELRESERWREGPFGEGVVRATGRRLQPVENGWRWFGLKAHVCGVTLSADLEMHLASNGYVGLCRLNNGEVNVCGLFRRRSGVEATSNGRELLRGQAGTPLHERLANAVFDERSFCSVAGLALRPRTASMRDECCVGDAITMTPPVTGNGMSMAFESAEIATELLAAWSTGKSSWNRAQQAIARQCDRAFHRRLLWARWLQAMMFTRRLPGVLVCLTAQRGYFWRALFAHTR